MVEKAEKIWLDGAFVNWDEANVHILTHTIHYGLGVFEGIRCYQCEDGRSAVFRLPEHVERLFHSAHAVMLQIPFTQEQISQAILETLKTNNQKAAYIRPLVFIGDGAMGLHPQDNPIRVAIVTWPWGAYLGEEGLSKGIRAKISSFTRHHVNIMMTKTKACGNYVNSILAKLEVTRDGYDEAIMLDTEGYVCEATGENIFMVRQGVLRTPPLTSILAGITRDAVMTIARDLDIEVLEQRFSRDELYMADEVFFTGTAAEITPVREVDQRTIGQGRPGPVTRKLQESFFQVVKGNEARYEHWLTYL
ncbi:MAG: branched-chain amino acid transaminase [Deltaproteobacteria bacterium]|nr:branched-chain amino acid transaminase [Deltaproteobacteria bacterium]MBW2072517.1 branched-chain amino acid transaminase [Deltaproteobacteria bacterium]